MYKIQPPEHILPVELNDRGLFVIPHRVFMQLLASPVSFFTNAADVNVLYFNPHSKIMNESLQMTLDPHSVVLNIFK